MAAKGGSPVILAAGSDAGVTWFADASRKLFVWTPDVGSAAVASAPVPGTADIAGVDLPRKVVIVTTGERFVWCDRNGWAALPCVVGTETMVKAIIVAAHVGRGGALMTEGARIEMTERDFVEAVAAGRVRALREGES